MNLELYFMKHLNIKIYGQVQNVGFRYHAYQKAKELKVKGFIQNKSDGSVYIEAEGEKKNLNEFLDWCYSGPSWAEVGNIDYNFTNEVVGYDDFEIKY